MTENTIKPAGSKKPPHRSNLREVRGKNARMAIDVISQIVSDPNQPAEARLKGASMLIGMSDMKCARSANI